MMHTFRAARALGLLHSLPSAYARTGVDGVAGTGASARTGVDGVAGTGASLPWCCVALSSSTTSLAHTHCRHVHRKTLIALGVPLSEETSHRPGGTWTSPPSRISWR